MRVNQPVEPPKPKREILGPVDLKVGRLYRVQGQGDDTLFCEGDIAVTLRLDGDEGVTHVADLETGRLYEATGHVCENLDLVCVAASEIIQVHNNI